MIFAVRGDSLSAGQFPDSLVMPDLEAAAGSNSRAGTSMMTQKPRTSAGGKARTTVYATAVEGQPPREPDLLDAISLMIRSVRARTDSAFRAPNGWLPRWLNITLRHGRGSRR